MFNHTEIIKLTIAKEKYTKYTDVITTNEAIKSQRDPFGRKRKRKKTKRIPQEPSLHRLL